MDTSLMCNDYVETSYFSCDVFPSVCCGCGVLYEYEEEQDQENFFPCHTQCLPAKRRKVVSKSKAC